MMICRSKAVSVFDYRNIDLGEYAAPFVMNEETLQQKLEKLRTRHGRLYPEYGIRYPKISKDRSATAGR